MQGLQPVSPGERRIVRRPLREAVHAELLEQICRGAVPAGSRLSDVTLAAQLGVSRTPVREALLRLHREGMVRADMGRGFVVEPLSGREVHELYPILWTLECLALRLSPPPSASRLRELKAINRDLRSAKRDAEASLELDGRWHRALVAACANGPLLELIRSLKERLRRYEYAYMRDVGRVELSTRHHERIAAALSAGDLDRAVHWLERNWRISQERLGGWLAGIVEASSAPAGDAASAEIERRPKRRGSLPTGARHPRRRPAADATRKGRR
jgi:DNA-binding GntR family transcriptional regulator